PDDMRAHLLATNRGACLALLREGTPSRRDLDKILLYARHQNELASLAAMAFACPQIDPVAVLELMNEAKGGTRTELLIAAARAPHLTAVPEIRERLLRSTVADVLLGLLRERRPQEFEPLMLRLLRSGREAAIRYLQELGVPDGAPA